MVFKNISLTFDGITQYSLINENEVCDKVIYLALPENVSFGQNTINLTIDFNNSTIDYCVTICCGYRSIEITSFNSVSFGAFDWLTTRGPPRTWLMGQDFHSLNTGEPVNWAASQSVRNLKIFQDNTLPFPDENLHKYFIFFVSIHHSIAYLSDDVTKFKKGRLIKEFQIIYCFGPN